MQALVFWLSLWGMGNGWAADAPEERNLDAGRKVALVVGNQTYDNAAELNQAPRDAARVANTLEALGFEVLHLENATRTGFLRGIAQYRERLEGADVSFFYYAGHAIQVAGVNYLIPIDAELSRPAAVESEAINASGLVRRFSGARAPLNVVVLDACRNNPFAENWGAETRAIEVVNGLSGMSRDAGVLLAFSTAPDDVAEDSGVYAQALVDQLVRPCATLPQAFARVHDIVVRQTDDRQRPWLNMGIGNIAYRFHPAGCDEASCTVTSLERATERAETAFGTKDHGDFDRTFPVVGEKLACLDRPISPTMAARVHAAATLAELRNQSPERARGYLSAMQRADDDYAFPNARTGPDGALGALEPFGPPSWTKLPKPEDGKLRIDGVVAHRAPKDQPFVVQWVKESDQAVFTSLVPVGGELPPFPRKPYRTPQRLRRSAVPLALVGAGSLALAGAFDAIAVRNAIGDDIAGARRFRTLNNVSYIGGWTVLAAGAGTLTASFVVRQR